MPFRDKTGPAGKGPMTGQGRGLSRAGIEIPSPDGVNQGGGMGGRRRQRGAGFDCPGQRPRGRGRGFQGWRSAPGAPSMELSAGTEARQLKARGNYLKAELAEIHRRLTELESAESAATDETELNND